MEANKIIMTEDVNGKTYVVAAVDHWPFKYWVGDVSIGPANGGKRARTEDEALTILAELVSP